MISHYQSQINRLERDIVSLDKAAASEATKEAELIGKINRARDSAGRSSFSVAKSKLREVERYSKNLATIKKKQADISRKKAEKSRSLRSYQERQAREDDRERKRIADQQRNLIQERRVYEQRLSSAFPSRRLAVSAIDNGDEPTVKYDFFISHASEDKKDFVRELAGCLNEKGSIVWYDEFTLNVGDSLRREIDRGLRNSQFGIVVLSEHFFKKEWPQRELDGLVALETGSSDRKRVLPIWHKVSKDEVAKYSPTLADKVALNTSLKSVEEIANTLMSFIQNK